MARPIQENTWEAATNDSRSKYILLISVRERVISRQIQIATGHQLYEDFQDILIQSTVDFEDPTSHEKLMPSSDLYLPAYHSLSDADKQNVLGSAIIGSGFPSVLLNWTSHSSKYTAQAQFGGQQQLHGEEIGDAALSVSSDLVVAELFLRLRDSRGRAQSDRGSRPQGLGNGGLCESKQL